MKIFVFIFLIFDFLNAAAQVQLKPVTTLEKDSSQVDLKRQILYRQLLSGASVSGTSLLKPEVPNMEFNSDKIPDFKFKSNPFVFQPLDFNSFYYNQHEPFFSPFYLNGKTISGANYRLNNKLSFGGYSFGANSAFSSPLPNFDMNNFDIHGATMFMKYNVSKNFKIETSISVSQGSGSGF